ncbi:ferritin-like domain-containing protein [Inquilinus sp. CAU 1745]|uniref:ferritin-like domain-containing protein n=1 Tax=Inquilinus sp. CAU 1745 TaxID=3140369 RepID=UPI00325A7044
MTAPDTLAGRAVGVLAEPDPMGKVRLTRDAIDAWTNGDLAGVGRADPPDRPGRPPRPELLRPAEMPRRRKAGSLAGRIALLHALAHIELNAIDLSWDVIARFSAPERAGTPLPEAFFTDWLKVASEEAKHFAMLSERLVALGAAYGDLPAHDGLWQCSTDTAHDLAARLAVVPMVLEARGLDVTPAMIESLTKAGDPESAAALQTIHDDEIGHVAIGKNWFEHVCVQRGDEPIPTWQGLVKTYFRGELKRPFNRLSRDKAGFHSAFYEPIAVG